MKKIAVSSILSVLSKTFLLVFFSALFMFSTFADIAIAETDIESATHKKEAAQVQTIETYEFSGGKLIQFKLGVLAQYSYIIASNKEAFLVDPVRDIDTYLKFAKDNELKFKGVFLTHSHADFVAGHTEMANRTKSPIYISSLAGVNYSHKPLTEKSVVKIGSLKIKFLATPGHTPESMTAKIYSAGDSKSESSEKLELLLTGDSLFVGSVGRPDLMGGKVSAAWLASKMYDSWHNKLKNIGDEVKFYPGHGAGSLCGAHLGDQSWSTIGEQKKTNPFILLKGRNEFISAVIDGLPNAPQYFGHNAHLNKIGPPLVDWKKIPETVKATKALLDYSNCYVVDVRGALAYGKGHIPGSLNIALRGRLETWTGIMVPWGKRLVLTGTTSSMTEAVTRLHRVGYIVSGVIEYTDWQRAGLPVAINDRIEPQKLYRQLEANVAPVLVDVRLKKEWADFRIRKRILNYPLHELPKLLIKLEKDKPVLAVCNSAYRSSLAVGVFERNGFTKAASLDGGGEAWEDEGYPMVESQVSCSANSVGYGESQKQIKPVRLPFRLSVEDLNRTLMDLPHSIELVDVRPSHQFADFHIEGSVNVEISELLSDGRWWESEAPLVIVCRDGYISMAAGGALSRHTDRQIKVLYGGVEAYWEESRRLQLSSHTKASPVPSTNSSANTLRHGSGSRQSVPVQNPAMKNPAMKNPVQKKRRRRSAGC